MASLTVTYTDSGDTVTVTTPGPTGSAAVSVTTKSLTQACDVAKGLIQQAMPLVVL